MPARTHDARKLLATGDARGALIQFGATITDAIRTEMLFAHALHDRVDRHTRIETPACGQELKSDYAKGKNVDGISLAPFRYR